MRTRHMPMEVLGLHVQREHVCEQRVERARQIFRRVAAEIGWRVERRLAALFRVSGTHVGALPGSFVLWTCVREVGGFGPNETARVPIPCVVTLARDDPGLATR